MLNKYTALLLMLLVNTVTFACRCPEGKTATDEAYKNSTSVFTGKVIGLSLDPSCNCVRVEMQVDKAWKGTPDRKLTLFTNTNTCGFPFQFRQWYLVYAEAQKGERWVSKCSETKLLKDAKPEVEVLNQNTENYVTLAKDLIPFASENNLYGFKDKNTGEIKIEPLYVNAGKFVDGVAVVKSISLKWGFVDEKGLPVIPLEYDDYTLFDQKGYAMMSKQDKWGMIDKEGNTIIPFQFDMIGQFRDSLAPAKRNGNWGVIDREGKTVIPFDYQETGEAFVNGMLRVKKYFKWGMIDKTGAVKVPIKYEFISYNITDSLIVVEQDGYKGLVDIAGSMIIPIEYDDIQAFSVDAKANMIHVQQYGKHGAFDFKGNVVIPMEYEEMGAFTEGLLLVAKDGKFGFIDNIGKVVIPLRFDGARDFSEGMAMVMSREKRSWEEKFWYGFIDKTGTLVIPLQFTDAKSFAEGLAPVQGKVLGSTYDKWGYIDSKGKIKIPFQYYEAAEFYEGTAEVVAPSKGTIDIDKTGSCVANCN